MTTSENLDLPYIMPSQAQKHVTHNEAIRALDAILQLTVLSRSVSSPPAGLRDGGSAWVFHRYRSQPKTNCRGARSCNRIRF